MFLEKPYIQVGKFPNDSDRMVSPRSLTQRTKGKYWKITNTLKNWQGKKQQQNMAFAKVVDLQGPF